MMKMLVSVELDGELYEKLRESAKSQGRSAAEQAAHILRAHLGATADDDAEAGRAKSDS